MEFHEHEHKEHYAKGGTTALGIIGTTLGGLGLASGSGILSNLGIGGDKCHESTPVNRYELALTQENAQLRQQISLRDSQVYVDQKLQEVTAFFNGRCNAIEAQVAAQAVLNQKTEDAFALVGEKLGCLKNEFMAAICREKDDRICSDNTIVGYTNATFYPKMVASVTTGTETTAQTVYNPLVNCGCAR
jgi:hypothetical protein